MLASIAQVHWCIDSSSSSGHMSLTHCSIQHTSARAHSRDCTYARACKRARTNVRTYLPRPRTVDASAAAGQLVTHASAAISSVEVAGASTFGAYVLVVTCYLKLAIEQLLYRSTRPQNTFEEQRRITFCASTTAYKLKRAKLNRFSRRFHEDS